MRSSGARVRAMVTGLLLAIAASFSTVASAGPGAWTTGGPWGGYVRALAIDPTNPSRLYAGAEGGVFRSTDSGATWTPARAGLTTSFVLALAIDPATPGTLYASTNREIFKSTDAGDTWAVSWMAPPQEVPFVWALAINPATPSTLYAGTMEGVLKSVDSGTSWSSANTGLNNAAYALAIDPATPSTIYAGTPYGFYKSTDSGGRWNKSSAGLTYQGVGALAVNPVTPSTLYAGTGRGVFKSTDSGASWTAASAGLEGPYASVSALVIDPANPARLVAATRLGVFQTFDSGGTWVETGTGLEGEQASAVAVDPTLSSRLHVGTDRGLRRSTDSGSTWVAADRGLSSQYVNALAVEPVTPSKLYAGTRLGLFSSTDSGGTWTDVHLPTSMNYGITALAIAPSSPDKIYVATAGGEVLSVTDPGKAGFAAQADPSYVRALAVDPATPSTVYSATDAGLFKSTDSAKTWTAANTGLAGVDLYTLAIDPVTPSTLYAGGDEGVFRSVDSGGSWTATGAGPVSVTALAIDPIVSSTLYAGTIGGIFRSADSGESWVAASVGLTNPLVLALVLHPSLPSTLYAGTTDGLFVSTDSGGTWSVASRGLPHLPVVALALDPSGPTTLFAGLASGSVWQATPPPVTTATRLLLPSSARGAGAGGAFYTTDLTVANTGATPEAFVLKFLGHDADGRGGPEKTFPIAAGSGRTFRDVLGSVFEGTSDFGAIRITSLSDSVRVLGQTSTPGFGGTFGQSVPAARPEDLVTAGTPRSILAVREDASFRTNLVLANATEVPLDVDVTLVADTGVSPPSASRRFTLPPLGMTQVTRVVRELGVTADVSGARLVISTPSLGGSFAAYASVIDNVTNDPRTLLPVGPITSAGPSPDTWLLPSSSRASGAGGSFYTTDLTVAYTNAVSARYTLKLLGHDADGRSGPEKTFDLGARKSVTYADVLGSVFQKTSDYGAIRISSRYPYSDAAYLAVLAQTSTAGFGGTFGQSVPAAMAADLIRSGTERSILAVREDDAFRTNLILANATEASLDVDVRLVSAEGADLATKRYSLLPLGMTQVTKVVRDVGIATNVTGARIVLSTSTANGAFAAYASVIDNVTNDPRTLLPR